MIYQLQSGGRLITTAFLLLVTLFFHIVCLLAGWFYLFMCIEIKKDNATIFLKHVRVDRLPACSGL